MTARRRAAKLSAYTTLLAGTVAVMGLMAATSASAHYLYVNNNDSPNSVSAYSVNLSTGALTTVAGSPFATGGDGGFSADIDSLAICGSTLYASNTEDSVSVFRINEATGALTAVAGSPFAAGDCATGLACTPDGKRLYVGNFCDDTIGIFDVDAVTGALSVNASSPFSVPGGSSSPFDIEIDSAGTRLFVSQDFSDNVGVYDIDGSGGLTPVAGSPFAAGGTEHGGVLSPNGLFYYVADLESSISGFTVGGGGTLTTMAGSPFTFPASDTTMTADNAFLIATDDSDSTIGVFSVNAGTGVPTAVIGSPFTADDTSPGGVVTAHGYVFVANGFFNNSSTVSVYTINGTTGALGAVSGSPFARGTTSPATGIAYHDSPVCSTPLGGCKAAGKSLLALKNNADDSKDKLTWKWLKGAATTLAELGTPTGATNYTLCVYAGSAAAIVAVPAGSDWQATGTTGFKFKDPSGTPDGAQKASLKSGGSGKAKALVKGKGTNLPDTLAPPLSLPVTVQLVNDSNSTCFEAVYSSFIKNDVKQFKAKAP